MADRKFILVKTVNNNHHVLPIDLISNVESYKGNGLNLKSTINLIGVDLNYNSIETAEQIYFKIKNA